MATATQRTPLLDGSASDGASGNSSGRGAAAGARRLSGDSAEGSAITSLTGSMAAAEVRRGRALSNAGVPKSQLEEWEEAGDGSSYVLDLTRASAAGGEAEDKPGARGADGKRGAVHGSSPGRLGDRVQLLPMHAGESGLEEAARYGSTSNMAAKNVNVNIGKEKHASLGAFAATALAGNDITSSCLYVIGLCAASAGKLAPVCLLLVAVILALFRRVYGEVVSAIPVNGGSFTLLLNATTKNMASLAAVLSLLAYLATGVVSAADSVLYAQRVAEDIPNVACTIGVLFIFAALSIWGVADSARVAMVMFSCHLLTLATLAGFAIAYVVNDGGKVLKANWDAPLPDITANGTLVAKASLGAALLFGTSSAMLGVSGFETVANFVEETKAPDVLLKTLRNTWFAVAIINPTLSLLAMGCIPLSTMEEHPGSVLATLANETGGDWLRVWVCVDATVVLCGAVLTAYVGVTGLVRRLAMDRVLPEFLLHTNKLRGTNHLVIIGFFGIASSLVLALDGSIDMLSQVYTSSFLGVMVLMAVGCLILKWKRPSMPRATEASWAATIIAGTCVLICLFVNVVKSPQGAQVFLVYFTCTGTLVALNFQRLRILRLALYASRWAVARVASWQAQISARLTGKIVELQAAPLVFFAKTADLALLNKAVLYVRDNEVTQRLCIVHCCRDGADAAPGMADAVALVDSMYPKLRIDYVEVRCGDHGFGPKVIEWLSRNLLVPPNLMFIASPDSSFGHTLGSLGGVRVISRPRPRGSKQRHRERRRSDASAAADAAEAGDGLTSNSGDTPSDGHMSMVVHPHVA